MYGIIMAGGSGMRFWPRSREGKSKQFLKILGKQSLLQSTLKRFKSFIPCDNIYVVTRKNQESEIEKHTVEIPLQNILYEPIGKNTAPCIGLAAITIQQNDPNAVVVVSPADHLIKKEDRFRKAIFAAVQLAEEKDGLVTIGISPDRPATGYGYIQIDGELDTINGVKTFKVRTFAEKPDLETAKRFLKSGDFFWNSGIFIFRIAVFLKALEEFLPSLYDGLMEIKKCIGKPNYNEVFQKVYQQIKSISIDYGVMEKAKNVYLVKGDFLWNDLGSWEQVYKLSPKDKNGNVVHGNVVYHDTKNSYISASDGMVAVLGLEDIVIVQDEGAILVCRRKNAEDVKQIVERLKRQKFEKYI